MRTDPFSKAQRRYDHELPPGDTPEPEDKGALPCACGKSDRLYYGHGLNDEIWVECGACHRQGPRSLWRSDCIEAWNAEIEELRREE